MQPSVVQPRGKANFENSNFKLRTISIALQNPTPISTTHNNVENYPASKATITAFVHTNLYCRDV
jgi:hypothetical protein